MRRKRQNWNGYLHVIVSDSRLRGRAYWHRRMSHGPCFGMRYIRALSRSRLARARQFLGNPCQVRRDAKAGSGPFRASTRGHSHGAKRNRFETTASARGPHRLRPGNGVACPDEPDEQCRAQAARPHGRRVIPFGAWASSCRARRSSGLGRARNFS
jgi:hypothetical protein